MSRDQLSRPSGHVDTAYGPMPGCPDCGVIVMHGQPHLCEHGVTPAPSAELSMSFVIEDAVTYRRLNGETLA